MIERFHFDADGERLTAQVHAAKRPMGATFLLGHGASGGSNDRFIADYAAGLAERGVLVVTYDFPFREHRRRGPDPDEVLQASCQAAIVAARQCRPKNHLFVGGKSLGGRVAAEVLVAGGEEVEDVAGLVVLGYPLHALGKRDLSRGRLLAALPVPALVVQGTRDPFGTADELGELSEELPRGSELHVVEGGDHSFVVPRQEPGAQDRVHAAIEDEIVRWMTERIERPEAAARVAPPRRPIASHLRAQLRSLRRGATS